MEFLRVKWGLLKLLLEFSSGLNEILRVREGYLRILLKFPPVLNEIFEFFERVLFNKASSSIKF